MNKKQKKEYDALYYIKNKRSILKKIKTYRSKKDIKNKEKIRRRIYEKENYETIRNRKLLNDFGITLNDYNVMLNQQNNKCKICKNTETAKNAFSGKTLALAVDHCHITGKVRSLLCVKCNILLGYAEDNIERFKAALQYLIDMESPVLSEENIDA